MFALFRYSRQLLLAYLCLLSLGLSLAWFIQHIQTASWQSILAFTLPCFLLIIPISYSSYYLIHTVRLRHKAAIYDIIRLVATASMAMLLWLGLSLVWHKVCVETIETYQLPSFDKYTVGLLTLAGCAFYGASFFVIHFLHLLEEKHAHEQNQIQLEMRANEAELQMLRSQINPHFLFNSLNSISALTAFDSHNAREMTLQLAQFFRKTLALSDKKLISLKEELDLCLHFLAVEKIRFEEKLETKWDTDEASLDYLIPPMLLQPLIENAIKHGIRNLMEGGCITIHSKIIYPYLYITIKNPIDLETRISAKDSSTGTGLKNCKARLKTYYGTQARVISEQKDAQFIVEITLPLNIIET